MLILHALFLRDVLSSLLSITFFHVFVDLTLFSTILLFDQAYKESNRFSL